MDSTKTPSSRNKSPTETLLDVQAAHEAGSDTFINNQDLLCLNGSRGIFGGILVAQSLNAAQETISTEFAAHSMHCTFVSPGTTNTAIQYHVERVRDGRSFSTRAVRAIQNDNTSFLATVGFTRLNISQNRGIEHAEKMPRNVPNPDDGISKDSNRAQARPRIPYLNQSVGISRIHSGGPCQKRIYQWIKAQGTISTHGGHRPHLAALACMTDSYFLACAPHSHGIWEFTSAPVSELYDGRDRLSMGSADHSPIPRPHLQYLIPEARQPCRVKTIISLDHTIYFHDPIKSVADEWLLCEVMTNWAANGRALVHQKIWTKGGHLVASCIQEGIVEIEGLDDGRAKIQTASRL